MPVDRKTLLADPSLLSALGAHVRKRVPPTDADDVVQSVIADALAAEGAPEDADELRRWVFGVARNKIADFYRRTRREQPSDVVGDGAAPSSGRASAGDLLRWAERELPPGSDAKRTFEWMLREGDGEKLESIAASEKLPAPRVRKRVSRMREHFRARWAAYVAAVAAAGIAVFIVFYIFRDEPKPIPEAHIAPETPSSSPLEIARRERERAFEACARSEWKSCLDGLDRAAAADPAGDHEARVVSARDNAKRALEPQPTAPIPSASFAPPLPTSTSRSVTPRSTSSPTPTSTPTAATPLTAPNRTSTGGSSL